MTVNKNSGRLAGRDQDPQERVLRARAAMRDAVGTATDSVRRHTGLRLGPAWILPVLAAAVGATAALALRRRRRRLSEGDARR